MKVGQTQKDTKTFHDITTQSGSISIKKNFKIHKKFSKVDQNGLISKFYNALDNQGQLTDFISLATGLLQCRIQWCIWGLELMIAKGGLAKLDAK